MSKFKVGDYVRNTNVSTPNYGRCGEIISIDDIGDYFVDGIGSIPGQWLQHAERTFQATPKVKTIFEKGDYIVLLSRSDDSFKTYYCYKQREDCDYIRPEKDNYDSTKNGWGNVSFKALSTYRFATQEEIAEYNRLGKPFDTTLLHNGPKETKIDLSGRNSIYSGIPPETWLEVQHKLLEQER